MRSAVEQRRRPVFLITACAVLYGCGGATASTLNRDGGEIDSSVAPDGGGDGSIEDAGDSAFESSSMPDACRATSAPVSHRAVAPACPQARGPGMLQATCDYDATRPPCRTDSDCTAGRNGRCETPELTPIPCIATCSYDECSTDSDCEGGAPCECRASASDNAPNYCVIASGCRVDADCGPCGYCSPSAGYDTFNCGIAYFCHTAEDACVDDTDCDGAKCQYDSTAGRWRCGGPQCAPPP